MKLEVGMYVRMVNDIEDIVVINKIANVFETTILTENDGSIYQGEYTKENVIKADYKIIKILEIGDYVNGCKVIKNTLKDGGNIVIVQGGNCFTNEEIETIVTHEQMEQMAFKVEE